MGPPEGVGTRRFQPVPVGLKIWAAEFGLLGLGWELGWGGLGSARCTRTCRMLACIEVKRYCHLAGPTAIGRGSGV